MTCSDLASQSLPPLIGCRGQELGQEANEEAFHHLRDLVAAETQPSTGGKPNPDQSPAEAPDGPGCTVMVLGQIDQAGGPN